MSLGQSELAVCWKGGDGAGTSVVPAAEAGLAEPVVASEAAAWTVPCTLMNRSPPRHRRLCRSCEVEERRLTLVWPSHRPSRPKRLAPGPVDAQKKASTCAGLSSRLGVCHFHQAVYELC